MANETTTKFKVDISQLKKGIQDANRQIRLANAEFKSASAGMDDWSKTADGLTAKIEQMRKVLASQKTILESYEKQLALVTAEYGESSKEADEMRIKLETQRATVKNTEKALADFEQKLSAVESGEESTSKETGKLDNSLTDAKKSADNAGKGFTVFKGVLTDLVATGIKAAIKGLKDLASSAADSFKSFDEGRDKIVALTGATGDSAADLMSVYKNVAESVQGDFSDIGAAVGELSTRFGVTGGDLETLSKQFLKFAKLNGADVTSSVDDVQKALSAFGLGADKAGDILDALNKVAQDTGIDVSTLTKGLIQNATAFKSMGLSVADSAALMGQMEKSGANAETVMNGLRKAMQNATKKGIPLKTALDDLEKSIVGQKDETKGLQAAYNAFGKSGDQIFNALKAGQISFKDIALAADDYRDSVDKTYEGTLDASDKVKLAFQGMKISVGETVSEIVTKYGPDIEKAIDTISGVAKDALNWLADNVPKAIEKVREIFAEVKPYVEAVFGWIVDHKTEIIAALAGIGAAIVAWNIANVVSGLIAFISAIKAMGVASAFAAAKQWLLNAALLANPIGLVVAAIAALVAAFVVLWKKSEGFRKFWTDLWQAIQESAENFIDAIVQGWKSIVEFFTRTWTSIKLLFSTAWTSLTEGAKKAWEGIKSVFGAVADWFKNVFANAWQKVKDVFSTGGKIFDGIKDGIVSAFKTVVNAIIRGINKVISVPFNAINAVLDKIKNVSIMGYKPFEDIIHTLSVPQIPELAKGGVLKRGQVGLLEGDGTEAVVPLENNKQWIAATASQLRKELAANGILVGSGGKSAGQTVTFNQYNNSPKALSRLEIYRQSKNLLRMKGATI